MKKRGVDATKWEGNRDVQGHCQDVGRKLKGEVEWDL
jgi:hypothetical protein